jgi:hypothetical protein
VNNVEARVRCLEMAAAIARAEARPADTDHILGLAERLTSFALRDNGTDAASQAPRRRGRPPKNSAAANPDKPA